MCRWCQLLLLALLTLVLPACGDPDAYTRAREMERKLRVANPDATLADPGYLRVAQALAEVPRTSDDYDRARELLDQIHLARRLQAGSAYQLGYLPEALEGKSLADFKPQTEGPAPAAPRPVPAPAPAPPEDAQVAMAPPPPAVGRASDVPPSVAEAPASAHDVILYSTSWCGYCRKARSYFQRNNIPFVEKDVEQDAQAALELRRKVGSYSGVPVIDIDGVIIRGYDIAAIKRALAAATP